MTSPRLVARVLVTNPSGTFDSGNPLLPGVERIRISASVSRTLEPSPNVAEVRLYNLSPFVSDRIRGVVRKRIDWSPEERAQLVAAGASAAPFEVVSDGYGLAAITVMWGYIAPDEPSAPLLSVGFSGQSNDIRVVREGNDIVTVIRAEDGGHTLGAGELVQRAGPGLVLYRTKSYAAGTPVINIIVDLIHACGLTVNIPLLTATITSAVARKGIPLSDMVISGGYTSSGPAQQQLRALLDALDLRWSIQDQQFLLLTSDSVLPGFPPIIISEEAGTLLGDAERVGAQQYRVPTWANPEARPGRQVVLTADNVAAQYRIDRADTELDTYVGGETTLSLDALQTIAGVF